MLFKWSIIAIELVFNIALFINAVLFIPQAIKIFREKAAMGVSLATFLGFLFIQLAVVLHGIIRHDYILVIAYLLSMLTCGTVVVLILVYSQNQRYIGTAAERLEMLENIIALMPGHVYWVNTDNIYLGCNDTQAKSAGMASRYEIIGKRNKDLPWNFNAGVLPEKLDAINQKVMTTGQSILLEEPATLSDGTKKTFLSNKVPMRNRKNEVIGMVGISLDITDRKNEEEQKKMVVKLENAVHDLRGPLTGILMSAQVLKDKPDAATSELLLETIIKASKRMAKMIDDTLTIGRQTHDTLKITTVSVRQLMEDVFEALTLTAQAKGLTLIRECPKDVMLISDYYRLFRIVFNLVDNAIKYTETGSVTMRCIQAPELLLEVEDTGIGIPKDKQNMIFERFTQLENGKLEADGAGIGLYVVHLLVKQLGGKLTLKSQQGKGSCFSFTPGNLY